MKDINNLHKELLFLLKEMDNICSEQDIKYSLFGGTMIGAARKNGFIPWDDDADVVFERTEYEKFLKVIPNTYRISRELWVPRFSSNDNTVAYLDIFIFDGIAKSNFIQKLHMPCIKVVQGMIKGKPTTNKGFLGALFSFGTVLLGFPFTKKFKLRIYDALAKKYKIDNSSYIFSSLDQFKYLGNIMPKNTLKSYGRVDFEDTQLMAIDAYDYYLTKFYGNYMQPPPVELQVPEHGNLN